MELSSPVFQATRERLVVRFGEKVSPWWQTLPQTLQTLESRWNLTVGEPVGRGNTSLVVRCREGNGRAAILKLTPEEEIARGEATALRSWESSGRVPELWGHDPNSGALLLEAIPDETPLAESETEVGITEVAELIYALHDSGDPAVGNGVVSLPERIDFMFEHWRRNDGPSSPVPMQRVNRGHELARTLAAGGASPVLLHGDLHAYNPLMSSASGTGSAASQRCWHPRASSGGHARPCGSIPETRPVSLLGVESASHSRA